VIKLARNRNIHIILHLHLKADPSNIPYIKKLKRTKKAMAFLTRKGLNIREVGYGWWRTSHKDLELKRVSKELKIKLAKRRFHIYDSWLK